MSLSGGVPSTRTSCSANPRGWNSGLSFSTLPTRPFWILPTYSLTSISVWSTPRRASATSSSR